MIVSDYISVSYTSIHKTTKVRYFFQAYISCFSDLHEAFVNIDKKEKELENMKKTHDELIERKDKYVYKSWQVNGFNNLRYERKCNT